MGLSNLAKEFLRMILDRVGLRDSENFLLSSDVIRRVVCKHRLTEYATNEMDNDLGA